MPGRLPGSRQALGYVLRAGPARRSSAGGYPAAEAERAAGRSLPDHGRAARRRRRALPPARRRRAGGGARAASASRSTPSWSSAISRLVPRKGFDTAIRAAARLRAEPRPDLLLAIAGGGRDERRLRTARRRASTRRCASSGGSPTTDCPALYGCADVFTMLCRNRWGGLEQEGFGIVFVEAAACGVPQVAGDSGGAAEAVDDGETGLVVRRPGRPAARSPTAFEAAARRPAPRAPTWARASRERARRRVLLRRAGRAPRRSLGAAMSDLGDRTRVDVDVRRPGES